ncbi:hypothetical protein QYF36_025417 [Acer negundo]|nr:hypothetical protein QYF36_025417 [Acer negundo]
MASSSSPTQEKKILLKEADGELFEVKELVAMKMETVKPFFVDNDNVTNDMVIKDKSVEEVKAFNASFLKNKSNNQLKELIMVANFLNTKELLDFLIEATANRIKGKSVEHVR